MNNVSAYVIAAAAGIGAMGIMILIFPRSTGFLSAFSDSPTPVTEPIAATISFSKIVDANTKFIPIEVIQKHPDLSSAIRHVEILYLGQLLCRTQSVPPTALVYCKPAVYSANVTHDSAESILRDILIESGTPPYDYLSYTEYSLPFAIKGRGAYSITITFIESQK